MENKIILEDRKILDISGVTKVKTATEGLVEVLLNNDMVIIGGNKMNISLLSPEKNLCRIEGEINSVKFGKTSKESLIKKVFK